MNVNQALNEIKAVVSYGCGIIPKQVIDEAISALEKQMPKKPQNKKKANDGYAWQWICPNCHIEKITTESRCCDDCGQALDWSDTE